MLKKSLIGVIALVALVAIGLAVWEPLAAERMAPPPARQYDARIGRDEWGVPHIFGTTDADTAYGVAYAHAEDDFSTIQDVLAMTRGRMGAISGQEGAKTDYVLHLLGARETARRDYATLPADVRALVEGYAAGLNRFADKHPDEVKLSRLFPVNGEDVVTGFVLRVPFFYGLDNVLGALSTGDAMPRENAGPAPDAPNTTPVGPNATENGSNGFAVAPRRSADGATRLVSNSHQPWRGGVAWYELVVHSQQGWDFAGATFPGAPMPFVGHNRNLGWTNTVNRPDLIDVYKLVTDGDRYRYDGQWRPIAQRRVWLPVKLFGPFVLPVPKTVERAVQGPVVRNTTGVFAIRYAGGDQVRVVEQYYRITKAQDWNQWLAAMAIQGVPATNFIYADRTGRIAHFYNAMFPRRKPGFDYAKMLPGNTSADFDPGTRPFADVPRNVDPASGFLMNANNTPYQAAGLGSELPAQDPLLGVETDTTNRGTRALELLGADASISAADLYRIKFDTGVSRRSWAGPWFAELAALDPKGETSVRDAQAVLAKWDWNFDGKGAGDALAALMLRAGNKWHYQRRPKPDARAELAAAAAYLTKTFGRLDPPLGTMLRLRQGPVALPLDGGPDVLRAVALWDEAGNGRLAAKHGDSYVMFVEWAKSGRLRSWSIQPFGAATTRPGSPHYADQAAPFVRHQVKRVHFDPAELAGRPSYRP